MSHAAIASASTIPSTRSQITQKTEQNERPEGNVWLFFLAPVSLLVAVATVILYHPG